LSICEALADRDLARTRRYPRGRPEMTVDEPFTHLPRPASSPFDLDAFLMRGRDILTRG
jgi:hypothetical protein